MKSVILNRGQDFYTDIEAVFNAVDGAYKNYNWLVTEPDATFKNDIFYSKFFNADYVWITGEELKEVAKQSNQFIWGIFSGFEKDITLEKVLEYELPSTECNTYWEENASIQHPLAETEIYAFDSSCTFVLSKTDTIIDKFINQFPMARELVLYNIRKKKAFKKH